MAATASETLRNVDYTDREFLHMVNDLADNDGYASTYDLAVRIFGTTDDEAAMNSRRHAVGSRMAYMVRAGFCEKHKEENGKYTLTKVGRDLMGGRISAAVERALEKMGEGDRGLLIQRTAKDIFRNGGTSAAKAFARRAWQHEFDNRVRDTNGNGKGNGAKAKSKKRSTRAAA